jgi:acyl-CoA synthetase (AMP-forming)/AMP-acid ligase II
MLVGDIARRNAEFFGDADAVIDPASARRSTWAELDARANRLARALVDLGLRKGDRLAIFAPNCAEYLDFIFGCARSGVIGAALNLRLSGTEIAAYLRNVEPAAALVHASVAPQAAAWHPTGRSGNINTNNNRREVGPLQAIAPGPVRAIVSTFR